jgi:hypothetical protein
MGRVFLFIWQFPQNIVGLLLIWILHPMAKQVEKGITILTSTKMNGYGVSLGQFIILDERLFTSSDRIALEIKHSKISKIFGLSYFIIIGIPLMLKYVLSL